MTLIRQALFDLQNRELSKDEGKCMQQTHPSLLSYSVLFGEVKYS